MPAPTNISAATAIEILALPFSTTQVVDFAGTTYTVWYKYTFLNDTVLGVWGLGSGSYIATCDVYGPNSSIIHANPTSADNVPLQFQGFVGEEYFFKFTPNGGNPTPANLELSVELPPEEVWPTGALLVPNDTEGNPGTILDPTTGEVLRMLPSDPGFPIGEQGDSFLDDPGVYLTETPEFGGQEIILLDADFVEIMHFTPLGTDGQQPYIRANKTLNLFYVLSANASDNWILQSVTRDGTVSAALTTITVGQSDTFMNGFAVANDGNIVYVEKDEPAGSPTNTVIKRWDIDAGAFIANLAGSIGDHYFGGDILVLEDDNVVVLYRKAGSGGSVILKVYDITGATVLTVDLGAIHTGTGFTHLAYALDSPTSFWAWVHPEPFGQSRFINVRISDGVFLQDFTIPEYIAGVWSDPSTPDPTSPRFGPTESCPFFLAVGIEPPPDVNPLSGIYKVVPNSLKSNDTVYTTLDPETTEDVKIPDPYFKSGLIGQ